MRISAIAVFCGVLTLSGWAMGDMIVTPFAKESDTYCRTNGQNDVLIPTEGACPGVYVIKIKSAMGYVNYCPKLSQGMTPTLLIMNKRSSSIMYECRYGTSDAVYRIYECQMPGQTLKNGGIIIDEIGMRDTLHCENPPKKPLR